MDVIDSREEEALLQLCSMFEKLDVSTVLEVVRRNHCDVDRCIDELINIPDPEPQPQEVNLTESAAEDIAFEKKHLIDPQPFELTAVRRAEPSPTIPTTETLSSHPMAEKVERHVERLDRLAEKAHKIQAKKVKLEAKLQQRAHKIAAKQVQKQKKQGRDKKKAEIRPVASETAPVSPKKPTRTVSDQLQLSPNITIPPAPNAEPESVPIPLTLAETNPATQHSDYFCGSIPKDLPPLVNSCEEGESFRELALRRRISELEAENVRLEEEKRNAMRWVIEEMRRRIGEKDDAIAERDAEINRLKDIAERKPEIAEQNPEIADLYDQIRKLQNALRASKQNEFQLEAVLNQTKANLIDGAAYLSRNITEATEKGIAKVQERNADNELVLVQKLREFAETLRAEISRVFKGEESRSATPVSTPAPVSATPVPQPQPKTAPVPPPRPAAALRREVAAHERAMEAHRRATEAMNAALANVENRKRVPKTVRKSK
eukprot:TRINITY_DN881_c0_g1_i1.p1 TRINITY_DN881_c0_g1~~TRINITY_DN881_c0_g1_i1.p1  ORF type:complete len:490 (+),score=159.16 TRINITY_DN881_c0_g1_i1:144-1613(+)